MKIVVADPLPESALALLRAEGWEVDAEADRPRAALESALADADALIVRSGTRVDVGLLRTAPRLRLIARAGTGVDNVDLDGASARGILVVNAPGANSVSVAEHACALMLALARSIARADAAIKEGHWGKQGLVGAELRGKALGVVGLGRVGREVVTRAHAFGMEVVASDPFIAPQVASELGIQLVDLDELCRRCHFISLHLPSTPATRHLFNRERLARCKRGARLINTARGDLIDEEALADAIEGGRIAGAALDVFEREPPGRSRLTALPQVIATPHIAASTLEAQELVGLETTACVRDFLRDGLVRNAVNFPAVGPEDFKRLQPFRKLGERVGRFLAQLTDEPIHAVGVRYYGELAEGNNELVASAVLLGVFQAILSSAVTAVNARTVAAERGIEVIESRSSRARNFTSLLSVKLHTRAGELWAEGAVFEPASPRLVLLDGVDIEAPLEGTLIVIRNVDQPGVIGEVGTTLGRHHINIATFALGRGPDGAIGVVTVDERRGEGDVERVEIGEDVLAAIRRVPGVRAVRLARL